MIRQSSIVVSEAARRTFVSSPINILKQMEFTSATSCSFSSSTSSSSSSNNLTASALAATARDLHLANAACGSQGIKVVVSAAGGGASGIGACMRFCL